MTGNPQEQQQRHGLDGFFGWVRGFGLQRNTDDKWVAGVCSGLANRLGVDPVLVRGGLLLLIIFGGFGLTLYLVAWALLPDRNDHIVAEGGIRHGEGWGIVLLVVIGIVVFSDLADRWWIWTILLPTAVLLGWVVKSSKAGRTPEQMGEEATHLANTFASRVESWGAAQGRRGGHGRCGGAGASTNPTASYAGSSPPGAAPVSPPSGSAPFGATPGSAPFGATPATPATPAATAAAAGAAAPAAHTAPVAPHGMGPGRTGTVSPPAPRVVRKRRRRAGILGLLLTVGLALAAYGVGTQAAPDVSSTASPEAVGLAAALAAAGLALVLIGLVGRRAGFAGFLATALAVVAVLSTTTSPDFVTGGLKGGLGDRTWVASSQPAGGFRLGFGDATLDLTGAADGGTVTVKVGAGDLTITVPKGTTATTTARVGAGDVAIRQADGSTRKDGGVGSGNDLTDYRIGSGSTAVTLHAELGAGNLTIVEEK